MSLFIGNTATHGSPLVITSGPHTLDEMKGPTVPTDTIFSVDTTFLECEVFSLENIKNTHYNSFHAASGSLPLDAINYISDKFTEYAPKVPLVALALDGAIIVLRNHWGYGLGVTTWDYCNTDTNLPLTIPTVDYKPSITYKYKVLRTDATYTASTIDLLVFNMAIDPTTKNISTYNLGNKFTGSPLLEMTKNDIRVKGTSLLSLKYVTLKDINSSTTFTGNDGNIATKISLVNSASGTTSTQFATTPTEVSIKNNLNEIIFSSSTGQVKFIAPITLGWTQITGRTFPTYYANNFTAVVGEGIILGGVVADYYTLYGTTKNISICTYYIMDNLQRTLLFVAEGQACGLTYYLYVENVSGVDRLVIEVEVAIVAFTHSCPVLSIPFHSAISVN